MTDYYLQNDSGSSRANERKRVHAAACRGVVWRAWVALWLLLAIWLGCASVPAGAHFGVATISLTRVGIEPHNAFLDVRITGDASDLRDIIHANVHSPSPLTPLTADELARAQRYVNKHLQLTQQAVRLRGEVREVHFA